MQKQQINLFLQLPKPPRFQLTQRSVVICYIAFFLLLMLDYGHLIWQKKIAEKQLQAMNIKVTQQKNKLAELMKAYPIFNEKDLTKSVEELEKQLQDRIKVFSMLAQEGAFSNFLLGLSRGVVANVWLTQIIISNLDFTVNLLGYAGEPIAVQHFLDSLAKQPEFAGMTFSLQELLQVQPDKEHQPYISFRALSKASLL